MTEPAKIGDNKPPANDFEKLEMDVLSIYGEAKLWLDGEKLTTDGQATAIGNMVGRFRVLAKTAKELFTTEKAPHLEASRACDAKYKDVKADIERASKALKSVLTDWQIKKDEELRAEQKRLEDAAAVKQAEAQEALQASEQNLEDREAAEVLVAKAEAAKKSAKKAGAARASAGGEMGSRAIGLTTVAVATVIGPMKASIHYSNDPWVVETVQRCASRDAKAGMRDIPGVEVTEERKAR